MKIEKKIENYARGKTTTYPDEHNFILEFHKKNNIIVNRESQLLNSFSGLICLFLLIVTLYLQLNDFMEIGHDYFTKEYMIPSDYEMTLIIQNIHSEYTDSLYIVLDSEYLWNGSEEFLENL
tara:strand:+ start:601 stop:966 length:366 start_codon:yes stop_codon:yes gene_type:complete